MRFLMRFSSPDSFVLVIWQESLPGLSWLSIETSFPVDGARHTRELGYSLTPDRYAIFGLSKDAPPTKVRRRKHTDTERNIRHGRPSPRAGRNTAFLAGRHFRDFAALRRPPGGLRAGCRTFATDRAGAGGAFDAGGVANDGRGGGGAARGGLGRRRARRASDAVERSRQLHQHAVAHPHFPPAVSDARDDARRMGGVQSV